jgi:hypothetical protein
VPWCPSCGVEYREGFDRCSECGVELASAPPPGPEGPAKPGPEWIEIASYPTGEEARLAQGLLQEQGIPAEVVDKHVVLSPFPQVDEAEVQLLVPPVEADRADEVLARAEAGEDELPEDSEPEGSGGQPR